MIDRCRFTREIAHELPAAVLDDAHPAISAPAHDGAVEATEADGAYPRLEAEADEPLVHEPRVSHRQKSDRVLVGVDALDPGARGQRPLGLPELFGEVVATCVSAVDDDRGPIELARSAAIPSR